jgi:hypothetical protein
MTVNQTAAYIQMHTSYFFNLFSVLHRLLARILRGRPILVQRYIYRKKGGGVLRKRFSGKPSKFTLLHISICSKLVRNFSNTLGFVSTEFVPLCFLLNYDIFIQPGTPSNWSKCQMYNNNENWSYFVSDILIYIGKSLKIISLFPQNLGIQRRPFFVLWASQDAWTPLLAKSLMLSNIKLSLNGYSYS